MIPPSTIEPRVPEAVTSAPVEVAVAKRPRRKSLALPIGFLLLAAGIGLSGTFLESTILPEGTIVGTTRRAAALGLCRILLAIAGLYFLIRRPRVTVIHVAALVPGAMLAVIVGAVVLQFVFVPPPIACGWKSYAPVTEQNQIGFRGRPIVYSPDDYVIVLVGDSQVEAMKLAFDAMPEQRLESHLAALGRKTKVFSIGAGGYGQDQELLALQEYFQKYRADLVVVWQTPANDIWNNVFKTHMFNRNPKPTFWLDASGKLTGPSEGLGQPLGISKIVVAALWERAFGLPWRDKSWERQLPEPYQPIDRYDGAVNTEWQERWNTNLGKMRDENLATEKSHLVVGLKPRSQRMQYGMDLTRALTQRIQELAAFNHAKLLLFQTDDHAFSTEDDQVYALNQKFFRVSKRQFEENWNYINKGFDTEIIPVTVKDWRVSTEDGHLNAPATDQVMTDLAARLRPRIAEKSH